MASSKRQIEMHTFSDIKAGLCIAVTRLVFHKERGSKKTCLFTMLV
ncbi:hypothetical protein PRUB_a1002 [Pseudoalteromonas rubra]|uniref:Uncharacterized protein n=1 Tax=Pseudoalteromonas rubra TaxID=43658 RepID=A0A8T0C6Y6_9GAMM|nr:hypothetical protein PRUB_a1002 [Pseudoalteromonas rubra]